MSVRDSRHDLDWLAFCYAADELSPTEAAAFEHLLGTDQSAREALAQAVELTQAIAVGKVWEPVTVAPTAGARWSRRISWMALGSAASLLVALLWSGVGPRMQAWPAGEAEAVSQKGELAAAWSETRQQMAVASEEVHWYPAHLDAHLGAAAASDDAASESLGADVWLADNQDADKDDAALAATPSWLTAAVLSSAGLSADADATPFDDERGDN
ncbi:MAG: hypothetical protein WD872_05585 [Pirellulaceae bacterium]